VDRLRGAGHAGAENEPVAAPHNLQCDSRDPGRN